MTIENYEVAKILDETADMLEVAGENFFRVRAYRNAARSIRDQTAQVADLSEEQIDEIPGIGADLAGKISTIAKTGDLPLHHKLASKFPPQLLELRDVPGLGPKRLKLLIDRLRIRDRNDLERAVKSEKLRKIRGFGPKLEQQIRESLLRRGTGQSKRMLYAEAEGIATRLATHLRKCTAIQELELAGSFRRRQETIGDLDAVAAAADSAAVMEHFTAFPGITQVIGSGETKTSVVLKGGLQVDLRVVPPKSFGAALAYFTGSKSHNVHLRRIAQARGLLLNEYGLFRDGAAIAGRTEDEIYRALGLSWVPPELREDRGEIDAAASGKLPKLIERKDLRGDLHTHSLYTDGRASIEEMVRQARESGLEYVAITDHSRRIAMAHGLDPERLREQRREVARIRKKISGIALLHGIEVDILDDGKLDLPPDALAELDWVVASVHYKLEQNPAEMTRRLIKAIRNPNVDVIGHPSGRLLGHREPSNFDLGEILRVAREEGCALEIDSQPDRLDLTDTACIAAKRAGVKVVISSDAHSTREFALLEYGINQARRGWIEKEDVLNTRPLKNLRPRR
ncbi:MAG: DNA polymerase/3'-5' exonuclease PolX [Candidatus Binatus sp.]|uniref:DNA polymerase/3'-5' exonuclease PolX n=1 Tax=Candidatus Binatus sp. TaxID=2811406 RepID=UPI0027218BB1|nr:DNA polymerase/3'-5' exonuclease PolX [Candidatus Binatus sp.]MDO8431010.1 DNA polymerase/3'-5' exonuclease PolX [Candidatus Binatus sp.]